jgi:hypothetical protein
MAVMQRRFVLALAPLAACAVLAACGSKEQAAPPATTLPPGTVAVTTTTTTTTTTLPSPPAAWKAARWGMSRAEVLKAFPGQAQPLAPPVDFGPPSPGPSDVGIPAFEDGGLTFRVLFGFQAERLDRVQLSAAKPGSAACGDVEKAVSAAHPGSAPERTSTQTNVRTDLATWRQPAATVTLTCTENVSLGFRSLTLNYAPPAAP